MLRKVEQFLRRQHQAAGGMVVAVSGGPDSVALLRALLALHQPTAGPLVLAHLNHQLRGSESDADEDFVRALHAEWQGRVPDLRLFCTRMPVGQQAQAARDNLEKIAREVRYAWLAEIAHQTRVKVVVTGHTANDQAETVLHRLLRGSGLQGLRGIAKRRLLSDDVELIRPLLHVTRAELVAYLNDLQQPYRLDATNDDCARTRNRIRHKLLPHLAKHYNPGIIATLTRLAEQADQTYRQESEIAQQLLAGAELPRAGQLLIFDWEQLRAARRPQVRQVFRLVWAREGWGFSDLTFAHWERLADLVFNDVFALELPTGVQARRVGGVIQLGRHPPGAR